MLRLRMTCCPKMHTDTHENSAFDSAKSDMSEGDAVTESLVFTSGNRVVQLNDSMGLPQSWLCVYKVSRTHFNANCDFLGHQCVHESLHALAHPFDSKCMLDFLVSATHDSHIESLHSSRMTLSAQVGKKMNESRRRWLKAFGMNSKCVNSFVILLKL